MHTSTAPSTFFTIKQTEVTQYACHLLAGHASRPTIYWDCEQRKSVLSGDLPRTGPARAPVTQARLGLVGMGYRGNLPGIAMYGMASFVLGFPFIA